MKHKDLFDESITFIKGNWKIITVLFSVIGFLSFIFSLRNISENRDAKIEVIKEWYNQLPKEDWIKQDKNIYSYMEYDLIAFLEDIKIYSESMIDIAVVQEGQKNLFGALVEKGVNVSKEYIKSKYELRDSDGKRIRGTITVDLNSEKEIFLYYDDSEMYLAFSKEEYYNQISSLANNIVFSYSDDPEIVSIYNGILYGNKRGRTKVHFLSNGFIFSSSVKVR